MPKTTPRILIADDQPDVLEALRLLLKAESYEIEAVSSPAAVLRALETRDYNVLLMDLNYTRDTTSGQEGLDLLTRIQALDITLPVVVMTAWGSIGIAVEAMRRGARDFVEKPWDNTRLLSILRTQIELSEPEIERIASTYHAWRGTTGDDYNDEPGFCRASDLKEIEQAQESLWLWSPWVGRRWPQLRPHLRAAIARGVDVRIIVRPGRSVSPALRLLPMRMRSRPHDLPE